MFHNLLDNKGGKINKNDIFMFSETVFHKNFLPTTKHIEIFIVRTDIQILCYAKIYKWSKVTRVDRMRKSYSSKMSVIYFQAKKQCAMCPLVYYRIGR